MATEDVDMDDDKWLYGDDIDGSTLEHSDAVVEALLNDGVREGTPDLDEIEATSGLGQAPIKVPEKPPELQLKTLQQQNSEPQITEDDEDVTEEKENGVVREDDSSDSDDDDVKITIGTILNPTSAYARTGFGRIPQLPGTGGEGVVPVKKVDLDAVPQINGVPLPEVDLDESIADKPWRKPGADITDYFNYGFAEETWRLYCEKQRKMRQEVNQLNKLVVTTAISMTTPNISKSMFGFPSMDMPPPQPQSINLPMMPSMVSNIADGADNDSENFDEKGTPPPDTGILLPKIPILPPPGLPPPSLPFPPQDFSAAAAMAAMFTGGPPPPIRPPDFHHGFPPPMPGAMPQFPPPLPGDMRPPFLPPGFGIGAEPPRGPITLDDPRAAGMFNPDMGFPPHWGDPTIGGHPDVLDFHPQNDFGRGGSRSPSRSSSNSSRGSSVERRNTLRREKGKDKYESSSSRSHHRSRRSRSHERSHHRSSRREHRDHPDRDHRDHRDRERERDRDRRNDRHEKERRERRRRDERRHERSSKRRRSRTPEEENEPTRDKKRSRSRSAS